MCGPPDFGALNLCVTRLAELSAAGIGIYSGCKTISLCRKLRAKREKREEKVLWKSASEAHRQPI